MQRRVDENPRGRAARLTLPVHIHAADGGGRGLLGIGVGENDNRILAAEFEADALEIGGGLFGDGPACRHRPDEADAPHIRVPHQSRTDLAVASEDIDDAIWENAVAQFAEPQARERCLLRSLDDNRIARRKRGRGFFGAKPERMVERVDFGDDAERLPARQVEMPIALRKGLAFDFGDEPGAIAQPIGGPDHVAAHADDRVAGIDGVDQRQRVGVFLDAGSEPFETTCALLDRHARPFLKRRFGGLDRLVDIRISRRRNGREVFHIRRIDRNKRRVVGRRHPLTADIEATRREI